MPIKWSPAFEVGIAEIDAQHRELFVILNRLEDAILRGAPPDEIAAVLDFLEHYTVAHFTTEEECMRELACPAAKENEDAHKAFLRAFKAIKADYAAKGATPALARKVQQNLLAWTESHVCGVDCRLKAHLRRLAKAQGAA